MKRTPVVANLNKDLTRRRKMKSELIEEHLDVVSILACKYANYHIKKEELISVGSIGLIKAAEKYDATKNVKFSTYASTCIKNEMQRTCFKRNFP